MTTWRAIQLEGSVGTTPVVAPLADDPDTSVLLVRTEDGRLHATEPGCPHLGQPLTHGFVEGQVIECGHHAYRYRLTDGRCAVAGRPLGGRLVVHEVRELEGRISVLLATDRSGA